MHRITTAAALTGALLLSAAPVVSASLAAPAPTETGSLTLVARFPHQATGITVSETGRIFVNFPRWTEDSPVSVGELIKGEIRPYPDAEWNSWRNSKKHEISAADHFVCVQSVVADGHGSLWVLDPAAPATDKEVPNGPKLVQIDLATNKVTRTIPFDMTIAPQGSYLNDIRFSPDGKTAFITDSGAKGAIVVLDLASGKARRLLDGDPTTQPAPKVVVTHNGKPVRRPDGRGVEFAADSIELSKDGKTLYWKPVTGKTLYSIETAMLVDPSATPSAVSGAVKTAGQVGVTDGLWLDDQGRIYLSNAEDDAVRTFKDGQISTVVQSPKLVWPDTFSQGPDKAIYVTTSHIPEMAWYNPKSPPALPTELWKFPQPK